MGRGLVRSCDLRIERAEASQLKVVVIFERRSGIPHLLTVLLLLGVAACVLGLLFLPWGVGSDGTYPLALAGVGVATIVVAALFSLGPSSATNLRRSGERTVLIESGSYRSQPVLRIGSSRVTIESIRRLSLVETSGRGPEGRPGWNLQVFCDDGTNTPLLVAHPDLDQARELGGVMADAVGVELLESRASGKRG